ncbi:NUDIX domain-containing protein [Kitasatospora sp. NBC_00240]|uniref:NUDIX hydrolase n=1 Tax=Kitasatospora sp. NBC_00240 TaxID=2903567 RepID=UPI00225A77BA|nr:NUDIX domain-containing protein [Kitasatospora sp. NBC_00240]MCX5208039.1 NUDIX domain-containing protein [Kitasatospora sp. NBC_00240]
MSISSDQNPAAPADEPATVLPAARTATAGPSRSMVGLHLVLVDDGMVLLGRRRNTTFADGWWHLPAGHLEPGESVAAGMAREAREELGIGIDPAGLELQHVLHLLDAGDTEGRLQLFFRPVVYTGQVSNREPEKCHELRWWPLDGLPEQTVPYTVRALGEIALGRALSAPGWPV